VRALGTVVMLRRLVAAVALRAAAVRASCEDSLPDCSPASSCGRNCLGTASMQNCTAECAEGYSPVAGGDPDDPEYLCGPVGWVVGGHLTCVQDGPDPGGIKCKDPPTDHTDGGCKNTDAQSRCVVECAAGYSCGDTCAKSEYTCGTTGAWGSGGMTCKQYSCAALPGNRAKNTDGNCAGTQAGTTCALQCKPGFKPQTPVESTFTCGLTGKWGEGTGAGHMDCEATTCNQQGLPAHASAGSTGNCEGKTAGKCRALSVSYSSEPRS
jgi:hypothetical protein